MRKLLIIAVASVFFGVTGYAQVHGRDSISIAARIAARPESVRRAGTRIER